MTRLGVTGGIGSGKSYVCRMLAEHFGILVYDCDARAKQLMDSDETIRQQLTALVGEHIYEGTHLERPALAQYLFASQQHADQVNAIVHPAVRLDFRRWAECQNAPLVALESAILYESGFDEEVDEVIFVDAPDALRIERAMQRDAASRHQIESRIACQQTQQAKQRSAHVVRNYPPYDASLLEQLEMIINKQR